MEKSKKTYVKLGIFISVGLIVFLFVIFYMGSKENLFTSTFTISSTFKTVSGLKEGNGVRFSGIQIGTVNKIDIRGLGEVFVEMVLESSVKKFIKKDSEVTIGSEGLVGNKMISIGTGSESAQIVEEGDNLKSIQPAEIGEITENLNKSTKDVQKISLEIAEIVSRVNAGTGTLGQLINNESLYKNIDSLMNAYVNSTKRIDLILFKVSSTVDEISKGLGNFLNQATAVTTDLASITARMNSSQSVVGTLLTDTTFANNLKGIIDNANKTTANLEEGSFGFYQNMEALKHNFLFKGYFEDIGYWDKANFENKQDIKQNELKKKEEELKQREKKLNDMQKNLVPDTSNSNRK